MSDLGKWMMILGAALFAAGALLAFSGRIPLLGRLPGDFVLRRDHATFYFPLGTCLLLSAVLSLLFYFFRK